MTKLVEKALSVTAKVAWPVFQVINRLVPEGKPIRPSWSDRPLLKSHEKVRPPSGFPRETDSLCPDCVKEVRADIISGKFGIDVLRNGRPGEIKARMIERNGEIWMVKDCAKHGHYEDIMSTSAEFTKRMEALYPGSDFCAPDPRLRNHGTSSMKFGRGSVLTVDLTNRCNMMCDPCFMDANQVGYVHELSIDDIKKILDDAITVKPKRQLSVQFSGGEPTLSPHFVEAIRYAKKVGYFSVQCATNGIRFAEDPEYAKECASAGLRIAYFQFDGVGNENNRHRKIGNLFDVKLRAMENMYRAGIDIVLVVTLVNTVNDHQVGAIFDFAVKNSDKISFISFQPVAFTGRDENVSDEERFKKRYTLTHLAGDLKKHTGHTEPLRDWFPLSAISVFSDFTDIMKGAGANWGTLKCGCHPNCGVGTIFLVNKETRQETALGEVLNIGRFLGDVTVINDTSRGKTMSKLQMMLSILRNYNPSKAPKDFRLKDLLTKFDKQSGGSFGGDYGTGMERKFDKWLLMFVAGMWFQDLWNYDFRRTERCSIPYGTQEGEISFCAYNSGIGWRNIVEHFYKNASVGEWYKKHGRHAVYADHRPIELDSFDNTLQVPGVPSYDASEAMRTACPSLKSAVGFDV